MPDQDDGVLPFRPRRRPAERLSPAEQALSRQSRSAAPGARALAAEQAGDERLRFARAANRQRTEELLATGRPVPARMTIALDIRELDGPEVDIACGAEEPAVDMWEAGLWVPTGEQVVLLAKLTDFPIPWFYEPIPPGPLLEGAIICWSGRRGCESVVPDVVTEEGVLLYEGKPRTVPKHFQGTLLPGLPPAPKRSSKRKP